jgi:hypothetical protein
MRKLLKIIAVIGLISKCHLGFSWSDKGHSIILGICKKFLKPGVREQVEANLGFAFSPEPLKNGVKNLEKGSQFSIPCVHKPDKTCVIIKKDSFAKELETLNDKNNIARSDLNMLIYLVSEIHQPLNLGSYADKVRQVKFKSKTVTLLELWQSKLIDYKGITMKDCLAYYNTDQRDKSLERIDFEAWQQQSGRLLSDALISKNKEGKYIADDKYISEATTTIKLQLLKAGIRLAAVLNKKFS